MVPFPAAGYREDRRSSQEQALTSALSSFQFGTDRSIGFQSQSPCSHPFPSDDDCAPPMLQVRMMLVLERSPSLGLFVGRNRRHLGLTKAPARFLHLDATMPPTL
ncbi:hypothetical protein SETIT_1G370100v2 [Setaria italica]|uniref:Uncharacterized protein n=1 Tax=Setaria italica TaxID=4555 RepID=A0A368PT52_SETIT|nr:hypothetical protein SETIT_1G370100v2 [Setaria italica]